MTYSNENKARKQIVSVASRMIQGDILLIEGARKLCNLRYHIGASDSELFDPIEGFESETDDYPIGVQRQVYAQETLTKMDREMDAFLVKVRSTVISACQAIIEALE